MKTSRELAETLGMVRTAGPSADEAFEACVHLMVERGATYLIDFGLLTPNSDLPKSLNIWTGKQAEGQIFRSFYYVDELNEAACKGTSSYWMATIHNFPSFDGFAIRENDEGLCVRHIQIATNKEGESRKVSDKDLQSYMGRTTTGWKGDRAKLLVYLWFVLRADVYESKVDSCRKEHKSQVNKHFGSIKKRLIHIWSWHRLVQRVVKFDLAIVQEIRIEQMTMTGSWWSTNETELMNRCKEYEKACLESRMS